MQFGVVFPQTEIGTDPALIRDYAQAAEQTGYSHLLVYDHVLGAATANRPDWRGPYTSETPFHEPFVLFGYLAAATQRLEFVTGVLVLPQRQTALVAKQAAEVDVLSGGRLRLGIGVGWNAVEYEALGEDFKTRGKRMDEQITVLKALWAEPVVSFTGEWHRISEAGINPLPTRRSVPLWLGGYVDATLRRAVEHGDGYFPQTRPAASVRPDIERLHDMLREAGRDPSTFGIEARLSLRGSRDEIRREIEAWKELGATHISFVTMGMGLHNPRAHMERVVQAWEELALGEL